MSKAPANQAPGLVQPEVRQRILQAAQRQFAAKGYAGTSLREIARAAAVTKPMVYYYFGSKEGLYQTLVEQIRREYANSMHERMSAAGNVRDTLTAVVRNTMHFTAANAEGIRFLAACALGGIPDAPADTWEMTARYTELIRQLTNEGIARGELRPLDPRLVALVLRSSIMPFYEAALHNQPLPVDDTWPERIVAMLWDGLGQLPPSMPRPAPPDSSA